MNDSNERSTARETLFCLVLIIRKLTNYLEKNDIIFHYKLLTFVFFYSIASHHLTISPFTHCEIKIELKQWKKCFQNEKFISF